MAVGAVIGAVASAVVGAVVAVVVVCQPQLRRRRRNLCLDGPSRHQQLQAKDRLPGRGADKRAAAASAGTALPPCYPRRQFDGGG